MLLSRRIPVALFVLTENLFWEKHKFWFFFFKKKKKKLSRRIPVALFVLAENLFWENTDFVFLFNFCSQGNNAKFHIIVSGNEMGV
jgi:hypothetical protein